MCIMCIALSKEEEEEEEATKKNCTYEFVVIFAFSFVANPNKATQTISSA